MSEHVLGRADEIRPSSLLGGETNDDGRCVGQGNARLDRCPAGEGWPLQAGCKQVASGKG